MQSKVVLVKRWPAQGPGLMPLPLRFTVVPHLLGILLPPLFLIVRMFLSPLLLTFQSDLVILGVSRKFLAVIIGAAPTLALRLTADDLLGTAEIQNSRKLASAILRVARFGHRPVFRTLAP